MICDDKHLFQQRHDSSSFSQTSLQDVVVQRMIQNQTCKVSMLDAVRKPYHTFSQPVKERCFSDAEMAIITAYVQVHIFQ